MDVSGVDIVPLQLASLCVDCETITASSTTCAACGSVALLSIARALNPPGRMLGAGSSDSQPRQQIIRQVFLPIVRPGSGGADSIVRVRKRSGISSRARAYLQRR